jgi:thioesterase domain-containing protein
MHALFRSHFLTRAFYANNVLFSRKRLAAIPCSALLNVHFFQIRLNRRVIEAVQNHHRTQAQWRAYINRAFYLEDVEAAETSGKLPNWPRNTLFARHLPESAQFAWHVTLKRPLLQTTGFVCAAMTILIMWSEVSLRVLI